DQREYVGIGRKTEASDAVGVDLACRLGRDTQDIGSLDRLEERREAAKKRIIRVLERRGRPSGGIHQVGSGSARTSAAAARRSAASVVRTPGSGRSAVNRARSPSKVVDTASPRT